MDFEKEIPVEDFDTAEITPIKSLRSDPPPQYFTNIDGKYCKDVAGREELDELKALVDDVPWQPLQDGYSNFWFELTNDTLSPWLNFSAKTENAVIDWGDGSGEVALDTLTPTHTYSKAGKYVVKVKGVTQMGSLNTIEQPLQIPLVYVELANEVTVVGKFYECTHLREVYITYPNPTLVYGNFIYCYALEKVHIKNMPQTVLGQMFEMCYNLKSVDFTGVTTLNANTCYNCRYLRTVTLPSTITELAGGNNFRGCVRLKEIHCQPTTPPTIGAFVFQGLSSDYIIYVPVGTSETYKAASGWSSYADHILEEGQTPNRMMLAKFNSAKTEEVKDDELYKDENR